MKRWGILFSAILMLATVTSANASLINPSFETGDLTGWIPDNGTNGTTEVKSYSSVTYLQKPSQTVGDHFLLLSVSGSNYASVSQTFTLSDSQPVEGWVWLQKAGTKGYVQASIYEANAQSPIWSTMISTTGWASWSFSTGTAGTEYTIVYSLFEAGNGANGAKMAVDSAVPIPSAVLLLASGLISLVAIRRRKAK